MDNPVSQFHSNVNVFGVYVVTCRDRTILVLMLEVASPPAYNVLCVVMYL